MMILIKIQMTEKMFQIVQSSDMRILIMLMAVSGLAIGMTVAKSKNSLKAFK